MEIILAEHLGFCYGVKRAVNMVLSCAGEQNETWTLGPIIHNPQMVEKLATMGVHKADCLADIPSGTVIIRSHGVGPEVYEQAQSRCLQVVDATCPHVQRAQLAARELVQEGYAVIIAGEHQHPEVQSIAAWAGNSVQIVETTLEAEKVTFTPKIGVVAQTTFSGELFADIVQVLQKKCLDFKLKRTICTATDQRQQAALAVAGKVQIMIVIGGKNSANTAHLVELCGSVCSKVYHIETAEELQNEWFANVEIAGITAGASTPDWLIEEVVKKMQEQQIEQEQEFRKLETGTIVKGTVVGVHKDEVFVDVGYKAEGIIPLAELAYPVPESTADVVAVGQVIDVYVVDADSEEGGIKLSKAKADTIVAWDKLTQACNDKQAVDVQILGAIKGGLSAAVLGVQAFVPASQADNKYVEDLAIFVGHIYKMIPIEVDADRHKCVLSRRLLLEEERSLQEEKVFASITIGQIVKGTVRRITSFGAFVDIGGVDGLIHISDMSWQRIESPTEILSEGDEVEVMIQKIDTQAKRISLSLKQLQRDPWFDLADKLSEGAILKGKVTKTSKFGAFVKLGTGMEGLVHISEMADHRITSADEVVKAGQEVSVKVLSIDTKTKRIALSMIQAQQDAERSEYRQYLGEQPESSRVTIGEKLGYLFKNQD